MGHQLLLIFLIVSLRFLLPFNDFHGVQARRRHSYHKKHKHVPSSTPNVSILPPSPPPRPPPTTGGSVPSSTSNVFDVTTLGAVGDGVSDDTQPFKTAWEYACQVESGTVVVPEGYTFMVESIIFAGPCEKNLKFQIDGVIVPPDGPDSWPKSNSRRQWLVFYRANGMTISGGGFIDGRGEKWWNLPCKPHKGINGSTMPGPCDSPVALRFFSVSNVTVNGIRVQNSPQFHFRFDECRDVVVNNVTVNSPALSPNTDGIHVENSISVEIYNSVISNGDDCVSIGSGSKNVWIQNVTCNHSHGISIGSLGMQNTRACVKNITVNNTIFNNSDNGVRIKTWQGGTGSVSAVSFNNIYMNNVRNPIIIDQYYCLTKPCKNQTGAVFVSDVAYSNIKGTYDTRSPPVHFGCSDSVPCTNITLVEVELLPSKGDILQDPFCWNTYGGSPVNIIPPIGCLMDGMPRVIMENGLGTCS